MFHQFHSISTFLVFFCTQSLRDEMREVRMIIPRTHCGGNVWIKSSSAGLGNPVKISSTARQCQATLEMCQHQSFQMMCLVSWHSMQHGSTTASGPGWVSPADSYMSYGPRQSAFFQLADTDDS